MQKDPENPETCFCLPKVRKQTNIHICFLRHASHKTVFRISSLHSTKFEWCMLSAQLIARYQPTVGIFGCYLAQRLSPRIETTLFQTCLKNNLGYRKYWLSISITSVLNPWSTLSQLRFPWNCDEIALDNLFTVYTGA